MSPVKSSPQKYLCTAVQNYTAEIKAARVIFIHGTDAFQRDRCFKHIIKTLNIAVNDAMNSFLFYGDEFSHDKKISQIIETLNSYSFDMSEKVVSIRYFDQLHKDAIARIASYTENPSPDNKLIIVSDKMDSRLTVIKTIIKNSLHIETEEMKYQKHLLQWLNNYLIENKLRMDEQTKTYFTTIVEPDAFTAYNEMKKLELFVGNTNTITINDIKACTISSKKYTIFDLIDAVGYKQKRQALEISENLLDNEENLIMIITMLSNFFFTLWRLDALRRKGISPRDLSQSYMSDINPYFRDKYLKFISNFSQAHISNAMKQLYIADSRAKLSMGEDAILLTNLIYQITKN